MVQNPWSGVWVALVLFTVVLLTPATAQDNTCTNVYRGTMVVPTGTTDPPWPLTLSHFEFQDIHVPVAFFEPVGQGRPFYLAPAGGETHVGTDFPDFRIAFIRSDNVIWIGNSAAPISGQVPPTADEVLIWMRAGPDSPASPDGQPFGAEFIYGDDCRGSPSWYP